MAKTDEASAVSEVDELFDFQCPSCGWYSGGWPTAELAEARGEQHEEEHQTKEPMVELLDFEQAMGLHGEEQ